VDVLERVAAQDEEVGPIARAQRAELALLAQQRRGVGGRGPQRRVRREAGVLEVLDLLDQARARNAQPRRVRAREDRHAAVVEREDELSLELVAHAEAGQGLLREAVRVGVVRGLEQLALERSEEGEVGVAQIRREVRRLPHDVVERDQRRDHRDAGLLRHRDGVRDLRRVERVDDLVARVGVVVEDRIDELLGVRDRLSGGERRREAGLPGDVADEDHVPALRLGRERRVLGPADLVVDLDRVVSGVGLAVDLLRRLVGGARPAERRPGGVDRGPEQLPARDAAAPEEVRGPPVQVEDRRDPARGVEGQLLRDVHMDMHVRQARHQEEPARVDAVRGRGDGGARGGAEGEDAAPRDDHGLVRKEPLGIHRHDARMEEGRRSGVAPRRGDRRGRRTGGAGGEAEDGRRSRDSQQGT
jgi:hypothetical protein